MEGMKKYRISSGNPRRLGVGRTKEGCQFAISLPEKKEAALLLYPKGKAQPCDEIPMPYIPMNGKVRAVFLENFRAEKYEYNYLVDGEVVHDPCTQLLVGRKEFGAPWPENPHEVRCGFLTSKGMEEEAPLQIPMEELILYKVHTRGYTKQKNSKVRKKGTFLGLMEKIPYWKELGINGIELMPSYEFEERRRPEGKPENRGITLSSGGEKLNYWGYGKGYYFAPKGAYAAGNKADEEFKALVLALHQAGMECIMEFYFEPDMSAMRIVEILEFWKMEYHVDGFHVVGECIPQELLLQSPLLSGTKLFFVGMANVYSHWDKPGLPRYLAEYNAGYAEDIRRWLKGDEGMLAQAAYRLRRNPIGYGVINYLTTQDGFTLADLVSYNEKHNENNGEENRDGSSYNHSWNCGVEGPSRKASIRLLRKQQMKNAWLLLLLSQGTPLIYGGDEFCNSQNGNNNAYCQDNEIGWIDWQAYKKNQDMVDFVREVIAFRKKNPILHLASEPKGADYHSVGCPDISYHSQKAWYAGMEKSSRHLGILYCCSYGQETEEKKFLYLAYNFHWEPQKLALPNLPEGAQWQVLLSTSQVESGQEKETLLPVEGKLLTVAPRSILVLSGK